MYVSSHSPAFIQAICYNFSYYVGTLDDDGAFSVGLLHNPPHPAEQLNLIYKEILTKRLTVLAPTTSPRLQARLDRFMDRGWSVSRAVSSSSSPLSDLLVVNRKPPLKKKRDTPIGRLNWNDGKFQCINDEESIARFKEVTKTKAALVKAKKARKAYKAAKALRAQDVNAKVNKLICYCLTTVAKTFQGDESLVGCSRARCVVGGFVHKQCLKAGDEEDAFTCQLCVGLQLEHKIKADAAAKKRAQHADTSSDSDSEKENVDVLL